MGKTVKFAVSMRASEFKELETIRRESGKTRSQIVREALSAYAVSIDSPSPKAVKSKSENIKASNDNHSRPQNGNEFHLPTDLTKKEERQRRAIAAAGQFRSGLADLAYQHDKHLGGSAPVPTHNNVGANPPATAGPVRNHIDGMRDTGPGSSNRTPGGTDP